MKRTSSRHETSERIERQLPPEVVAALDRAGWNALGVYDLVRRELAAERRAAKQKQKDRT